MTPQEFQEQIVQTLATQHQLHENQIHFQSEMNDMREAMSEVKGSVSELSPRTQETFGLIDETCILTCIINLFIIFLTLSIIGIPVALILVMINYVIYSNLFKQFHERIQRISNDISLSNLRARCSDCST